jgi:hypothetical protein
MIVDTTTASVSSWLPSLLWSPVAMATGAEAEEGREPRDREGKEEGEKRWRESKAERPLDS